MSSHGSSYANYPQYQQSFYQPTPMDSYNNLTNQNRAQSQQLNLASMMPQDWGSSASSAIDSKSMDDYSKYSPTKEGINRYVSGSGSIRFQSISRSASGRKYGYSSLLRSQPPTALSSGDGVYFNSSSDLEALRNPEMKSWIGCG